MADNVTADPGSGGATFKTDEDTGASAHVPITKIELGANNSFDGFVSASNPMPVEITDGTTACVVTFGTTTYTEATSTGLPIAAVRNDTLAALANTDNELAPLQVNATGALYVQEGSALDVSAATVTTTPAVVGGGTEAAAQRVTIANDSTGVLSVDDNGGNLSVDFGGTVPVVSNDALQATGDEAHDAVDAGNPVKIGHKAIAHGTNPTAVAANDRTDWYANRAGVPWVIGGHPNIISREYRATTAQTDDDMLGAIGAGTKVVVTGITVTVDNAASVDVGVRIGFSATTIPAEPADGAGVDGVILSHPGIAAGSGVSRGDGSGIIGIGADGEELRITNEVPTGGSVKVIVNYYTVPS